MIKPENIVKVLRESGLTTEQITKLTVVARQFHEDEKIEASRKGMLAAVAKINDESDRQYGIRPADLQNKGERVTQLGNRYPEGNSKESIAFMAVIDKVNAHQPKNLGF